MLVYMATPIDSADLEESGRWRIMCREALEAAQVAVYDPATAFHRADLDPDTAFRINESALASADGLFAYLPDGVSTIGVPMEIQTALDKGKPVVASGASAERSMQLKALGVETRANLQFAADHLHSLMLAREKGTDPDVVKWTGRVEYGPRHHYAGDAGYDLVVSERRVIDPGEFVDVPCGICVELPPGVWAMVTGRSSTLRKRQLLVAQGVIDQGYRGPMFAGCQNLGRESEVVDVGDRIAQLIPFQQETARLRTEWAEALAPSDRGEAGFGSTGT